MKNKEPVFKYLFIAAVGAASVSKLNFPIGSTWYLICDAIMGAGAMFGIYSTGISPTMKN